MGNKGTQFSLSCCEGRLDPYVALHHCWWSSLLPALYRSHKILQVAISFISGFLPFFFYSSHISGRFQGFKLLSTSFSFNLWNLPEIANPKLENYQDSCVELLQSVSGWYKHIWTNSEKKQTREPFEPFEADTHLVGSISYLVFKTRYDSLDTYRYLLIFTTLL